MNIKDKLQCPKQKNAKLKLLLILLPIQKSEIIKTPHHEVNIVLKLKCEMWILFIPKTKQLLQIKFLKSKSNEEFQSRA